MPNSLIFQYPPRFSENQGPKNNRPRFFGAGKIGAGEIGGGGSRTLAAHGGGQRFFRNEPLEGQILVGRKF